MKIYYKRENSLKTSEIFKIIEKTAPLSLAEPWDNSGLQVGSYNQEVSKILTCLDLTDKVVKEAIALQAGLIITHHPMFFESIKRINRSEYIGKIITALLKNNISVYTAHTNLDKAHGGLNDYVANVLGLQCLVPLVGDSARGGLYKVVAFVPKTHLEPVLDGLKALEASISFGNYKDCTFRCEGTGTFTPLSTAEPFIGEQGCFTEVQEIKIEMTVQAYQLYETINKIKQSHPYEEAVIDVYSLEDSYLPSFHGFGRVGYLKEATAYSEFITYIKKQLDLHTLRECGEPPLTVHKVAICTGSGSDLMMTAKKQGADLYITGDLKHHDAQKAYENGICILDCGHYGTEKFASEVLLRILKKDKLFVEKGIEVIPFNKNIDFIKRI